MALKPVSEESSVTDVLGKVTSGEADAGLVYVTDVRAAGGKVKGIPFPEAAAAVNTYPIAALRTSKNKELAARLRRAGHRSPGAGRSSPTRASAARDAARLQRHSALGAGLAAAGALFVLLPLAAMVARVNWPQFIPLAHLGSLAHGPGAQPAHGGGEHRALRAARRARWPWCWRAGDFPGQRLLRSFVLLPLVLPPVVGGIALLYTFGRQGLLGRSLEVAGIQIAFSTTAVVLAQTFVALPFLVVSLEGALRSAGSRYEAVAATLGARPTTVLRRVTLPLVLPGLASGAVLSFARSLGEFGATLTFAGSLQGVTRTLPLEIYLQRETDADAAVALSLLLVAVAVIVVGLSYRGPQRPAAVRAAPRRAGQVRG